MTSGPRGAEYYSAFACAALGVLCWVVPMSLRADLFYDDVAHHVFWLYQYADRALFPGDLTVSYFHTSAPWGYRAIYSLLAPALDVLLAAKLLSIVPLLASCWLAWQLGASTGMAELGTAGTRGLLAVTAILILLVLSQQRDLLPPIAFQRAFALPLLLLTLWGLVSRRYLWVGISWLAAAFLYPVVLPVQGLTAAVVFLRDLHAEKRLPNYWIFNGLAAIAALAIAILSVPVPPEIGPPLTYAEAIQMPEFGPEGRLNLYGASTVGYWLTGHRTGLGWSPWVLLLLAAATLAVTASGRVRQIPLAAWVMACMGVAVWAAMRAFPEQLMFDLYLPNRHSRWAIGIFGMLALTVSAELLLDRGANRASIRRWVAIAAPIIVAIALLPNAIRTWNRPIDTDLENTYAFLGTLPKSTLVAAHPDLADFVPVRSRRSVLASTEASMAWMKGYYAQMKPRVEASLRAAYAIRIEDVDAALAPYGVDVMLTGPLVWQEREYYAPYDELVTALVERGARDGFVLKNPPAGRILFSSGDYYVIRVNACAARNC